jgi:hypothetical protein
VEPSSATKPTTWALSDSAERAMREEWQVARSGLRRLCPANSPGKLFSLSVKTINGKVFNHAMYDASSWYAVSQVKEMLWL